MILLPHKSITEFLSIFTTTLACVEMMIQVIMKLTILFIVILLLSVK